MKEIMVVDQNGRQETSHTLREVVTIVFRHRRLVVLLFLAIVTGALAGALMYGTKYEARTQLLVKHQRFDAGMISDNTSRAQMLDNIPTEEEVNSEIALLKSDDVLEQVVRKCGLDARADSMWNRITRGFGAPDVRIPRAVRDLENSLRVYALPKSYIVEVRLTSRDPQQAANILNTLTEVYMEKHLALNRPPGVSDFFSKQTADYHAKLANAENQLADFQSQSGSVAPTIEKEIVLQKASEFSAIARQTQAEVADRLQRIRTIKAQMQVVPERQDTQVVIADNEQLLAKLKSTLAELEMKHVEMLSKYKPEYRPVKELEQQIDETRAAIAEAQKSPVRQNTTDQNPTYKLLESELARAEAELPALKAKAATMQTAAATYQGQAAGLGRTEIAHQELVRNAKANEENYLLYLKKAEEAEISDALDQRRIMNVAVSETAAVPALPMYSPAMLILAGLLLAVPVSVGSAFVSDYFDPSIRTPREVVEVLDTPVLAWMPKNGHFPSFAGRPELGGLSGHLLK